MRVVAPHVNKVSVTNRSVALSMTADGSSLDHPMAGPPAESLQGSSGESVQEPEALSSLTAHMGLGTKAHIMAEPGLGEAGTLGSPAGRFGSPAGRFGSPAGRLGSPARSVVLCPALHLMMLWGNIVIFS